MPKGRGKSVDVDTDDEPAASARPVSASKPAFKKENGTVTPANASTISDGAAAVVLMSRAAAEKHGCTVLAKTAAPGGAPGED